MTEFLIKKGVLPVKTVVGRTQDGQPVTAMLLPGQKAFRLKEKQ